MPLSACLVDVLRPLEHVFLVSQDHKSKKTKWPFGSFGHQEAGPSKICSKDCGDGEAVETGPPPNSASHSAGSSRLSRDEVGPWETMGRARSRCCWDCHQVQLFLGPKWLYDSIAGSATAGSHPDAGIQSGVSACWMCSRRHKALGPHQHDGQPRGTGFVSGREVGQAERGKTTKFGYEVGEHPGSKCRKWCLWHLVCPP